MKKHLPSLEIAAIAVAVAMSLALVVPAEAAGPFQFHALTPCRIVDSRTTNAAEGTNGSPLSNGIHFFRVQGQCGVPNGAAAATLNFTIVGPSQTGFLLVRPANVPEPTVSTLNWLAGEPALANGAIAPLGPVAQPSDNDLGVRLSMVAPGTSHFIIDVTGYFQ